MRGKQEEDKRKTREGRGREYTYIALHAVGTEDSHTGRGRGDASSARIQKLE